MGLAALGLVVGIGSAASAQQLEWADPEFARLHESVCAAANDAWRTIPWETSLLAAQRAAVEQAKPLFIWAMDGHPLGCT
jgi:hypothetical protein